MPVLIFLGLAAFLAYCDWRHRAVPRLACMAGAALGAFFNPSAWSIVGVVIGVGIAYLAGLPVGDMAVGGMLGVWIGPAGIVLVWSFALGIGLAVWIGYREGWWAWPGEWPFTPFLLVPACAIVLGKGGW